MKKILVTGSEGFTGRYLCSELEKQGYSVVKLVREKRAGENEIECDLTDLAATEQVFGSAEPDGVIHLAAISFVGHTDPVAFYQVNVIGTTNLLLAMRNADLSPVKIVIASSANVYGNPEVEVVSENNNVAPVNHYATSKLAMENMVNTWNQTFPIIITRPFNYTGPGQSPNFLVPKIVKCFQEKREFIELGDLEVARDFCDVRDVVKAYIVLFESDAKSIVVNISSGIARKLKDIVKLMEVISGHQMRMESNPKFIRDNEISLLCGDNSRLLKLTGFQPTIKFEQTLRDMYNYEAR